MNSDAFAFWSSLYDDGIKNIWTTECPELRSAAMILHALKRELKNLEIQFSAKLDSYRGKLTNQSYNEYGNLKSNSSDGVKCNTSREPSTVLDSSLVFDLKDTSEISEFNQPISEIDFDDSTKLGTTTTQAESPKINKNRSITKRKRSTQLTPSVLHFKNQGKANYSYNSKENAPEKVEILPDFLDSSIIADTPVQIKTKKRRKKEITNKSKNITLTQLFSNDKSSKNSERHGQKKPEDTFDDSDNGSLYIDEILESISKYKEQELKKNEAPKADKIVMTSKQGCGPSKQQKAPNYVYKPEVVRGKARKDLPGWSCQDCKNFYEVLGLSPETIRAKMKECSKHKSKFPPPDDTPPGFWDMILPPTPATFYEEKE